MYCFYLDNYVMQSESDPGGDTKEDANSSCVDVYLMQDRDPWESDRIPSDHSALTLFFL